MMLRKRILAHIIDVAIASLPMIVSIVVLTFNPSLAANRIAYVFFKLSLFLGCFGIIFKDCIGGKSIGKRILKLKVISLTNTNASIYRLVLRNIILPIWYIDAFVLLILNKSRIGDKLAKTTVIEY